MEPRYSLIIPHFNTHDLLERLLSTIPKRNDLQVIVVDDCSNTGLEHLNDLKAKYDCYEWCDTGVNGGAGKARNVGLERAKGEYVFFADSDDFFLPSLNELLDSPFPNKPDIVFFRAIGLDNDDFTFTYRLVHIDKMFDRALKNGDFTQLKFLFGEPWGKLFLRKTIVDNNIRFQHSVIHNDTYFTYMAAFYSVACELFNKSVYCITERRNSVSKAVNEENLLKRTEIFSKKNSFLAQKGIDVFDNLQMSACYIYLKKFDFKAFRKNYNVMRGLGFSPLKIYKELINYFIYKL